MAGLRLQFLQMPALLRADGSSQVLPPKDAALLALLALRGPQPRAALVALLWPEKQAHTAHNNLRQRLFRLRRVMACELVRDEAAATLALPADLAHDLADPYAALQHDPQGLTGALLGAHGFDDQAELAAWLADARAHWRERLSEALIRLATEREAAGRLAEALSYAHRLVLEQPLLEHGVRLLMRLHYRRGDRGAALAVYERAVLTLHQQLGESPSDETIALAQTIGEAAGSTLALPPVRPVPLTLRHPPRLIGREALLPIAERRWQRGGVLLLTGPAGIGKTRLFDELVARWQVRLVCRVLPDDGRADLKLLGRLAAGLLPWPGVVWGELAPALRWLADPHGRPLPAGGISGARLLVLLREALALARAQGLQALALDDLHFADADSLALLVQLLPGEASDSSESSDHGLRWLLTCRDRELPPVLQQWLATREDDAAAELPLPPLDAAQLSALLASMALPGLAPEAWSAALFAHCGGHPLSLLQVLRELHDADVLARPQPPAELPVPRDVMRRVARWLDDGDVRAQQLAFVAALCGGDFTPDLARRLLGASAAELLRPWRQLEALNVFRGEGFSHELMRQAVLDAVPAALAPALHRDIALALDAIGAAPARRALHWEAAGDRAQAAAACVQAAEASLSAGLQTKALALFRHAAGLYEQQGQQGPAFHCRWRAGRLLLLCASAAEALDAALRLRASATTLREQALAHGLLAQARTEQHEQTALDDARAAVALAQGLDEPALRARARLCEASALQMLGRLDEALALLTDLRDADFAADERHGVADARVVVLAALGRRSESLALCREALQQALGAGELARAADQAGNCAIQLSYLCRSDEALHHAEQAVTLARRSGAERGSVLIDEMALAGLQMDAGRYAEALDLSERVVRELRAGAYLGWSLNAENTQANLFMQLGRLDLAGQLLGEPPAEAPTWARAMRCAAQARLAQARGQPPLPGLDRALALLAEGGALLSPYVSERLALERGRWRVPAEALAQARRTRHWALAHEHTALARLAALVEIDALLALGQGASACADALADEFAGRWQAFGFALPELWWTLCRAWDAGGQQGRADALAAPAAGWLRRCADQQMPALFRPSFLAQNPVNRALLARAAER